MPNYRGVFGTSLALAALSCAGAAERPGSSQSAVELPSAPSNLAAAPSGLSVALSWTPPSGASELIIERSGGQSASTFVQIAQQEGSTGAFNDPDRSAGETLTYRVRAHNSVGYSAYSNSATASIPGAALPTKPTNIRAATMGGGLHVTWTDTSANETGFELERRTGVGGTFALLIRLGANASGHHDLSNLTSGTPYTYRVRAVNDAGAGPYSDEAQGFAP